MATNRPEVRVSERDRPLIWTLLLMAVCLLVAGLPLPLTDGVTALYGKIAKNILASGDWLTLRHSQMPVVDKPPLTFWLMSLTFAAFGTAEWVLRLWHLALAVATALATYALGRLALPRSEALLAGLILLTTTQFFYQSLVPEQHVPLALFLTLAVYWQLRWERAGRWVAAVLAWLAAALAALTIGIAGVVMIALVIGAHLIVDRPRLPRGALRVAMLGAAVFLAVAAPWFVIGVLRQGRPFAATFFLGGTLGVGRFFHPVQASPTVVPWWAGFGAYLLLLPLGFLPWTGWLWAALRDGWAARRTDASPLWVCTVWVIVVVGFLSLSLGDKASRYLLPVFPPLAVLVAHAVGKVNWARQAAAIALATALPLLAVVTTVALVKFPADSARYAPLFWSFLPAFTAALVAYAAATFLGRPKAGIVLLVLMTLLAYGLTMASAARIWDEISPWRPIARTVNGLGSVRARLLILGAYNELADYYITGPVEFVGPGDLVRAWAHERVVAVIPQALVPALPSPAPVSVSTAPAGLAVVSNFPAPGLPPR
ncbi:MAG TPA: glycosyltransferase family 39 protein [bacterium]|nr:glycosyltransferase family 39 protein [bacterium]